MCVGGLADGQCGAFRTGPVRMLNSVLFVRVFNLGIESSSRRRSVSMVVALIFIALRHVQGRLREQCVFFL
jgi:hypothetical protein